VSRALVLAPALVALGLAGCVTERKRTIPTYEGPLFARGDSGVVGEAAPAPRAAAKGRVAARAPDVTPPTAAPGAPGPREERPARTVSGGYAGHRPLPPGATLEERARERFLAHDTRVVAREATVYVPERYAREAALLGTSVEAQGGDRRVALGAATLTLRRLTVRAAKVTLVARGDGEPVQITARGDVSFRSDQPASLVEEEGLRGLLIRDDTHTPLR
jgi:hypothetical protein